MRIFKTYLIWLLLPAMLMGLAILFAPLSTDEDLSDESLTDLVYVHSDRKLDRTVTKWIGNVSTNGSRKYLDMPGLPVDIYIKKDEWKALQNKINRRSFKKSRFDFIIRFNKAKTYRGTYKLRGAGSLKQAYKVKKPGRLCYNIKLFKSVRFTPDLKLKKFYLMNMIFDPTYFKMGFSYTLLHTIGLFPSYHQFVVLTANEQPQGVYLIVERPQDAIVRTHENVIGVYRRRNPEDGKQIYETKYQKPQDLEKWHLDRLHEIIHTLHGEELVRELRQIMDLDSYFAWLAFNSLVMCNDTSDEIYYSIIRTKDFPKGRIEFSAWDYDDLMNPNLQTYAIQNPLLFGCENELDGCIQNEPVLYRQFKSVFYDLLTKKMTKTYLTNVLNDIEKEGNALYTGLPMDEEKALKGKRKEDIKTFKGKLLARHSELLQILEGQ